MNRSKNRIFAYDAAGKYVGQVYWPAATSSHGWHEAGVHRAWGADSQHEAMAELEKLGAVEFKPQTTDPAATAAADASTNSRGDGPRKPASARIQMRKEALSTLNSCAAGTLFDQVEQTP